MTSSAVDGLLRRVASIRRFATGEPGHLPRENLR